MRRARVVLKVLNPLIALANLFMYSAHVESFRGMPYGKYEPYDFSRDLKYF